LYSSPDIIREVTSRKITDETSYMHGERNA